MSRARTRARPTSPAPTSAPPAGRGTRRLPLALLAVLLLLGGAWFYWRGRAHVAVRPNVLLVSIDTLRADRLGCYGAPRAATPVLDALARRGARFPVALSHSPLTAPAHASLLTGLLPPGHGVRDNGAFVLPAHLPTLAADFAAAGWRSAAFVSGFPLDRRFGFARAFEHYDDRLPRGHDTRRQAFIERRADATTDALLAWLATASAPPGQPARPWFVFLHYFDPHAPYEAPPPYAERAGGAYEGEVAYVDAQLGRVLEHLRADGSLEHTLVLVTADHGESLGEHGEETHGVFVYDATLRVPWIVAGPGVAAGSTPGVLARGVDVRPTLLDLAGLSVASGDGRSLRPTLAGQPQADVGSYAESLFCARNLGWAPLFTWRTAEHRLVQAPRPELYVLAQDPGELHDRHAHEPQVARRLLGALEQVQARPAAQAEHAQGDGEVAERLRALGYLGGSAGAPVAGTGSGRDPKDGIALVNRLERALTLLRSAPAEAEQELGAVLAQEPGLRLALRARALVRGGAGRAAQALADLAALEALGPLESDDLELRADTLRQLGRLDAAAASAEQAARQAPQAPGPHLLLARMRRTQGQNGPAAQSYEAALERAPEHPEALRGLAELAAERGDAAAARAWLDRALARDPEDAAALLQLGLLQARQGQAEAALPLFARSVELQDTAEARLALGASLARLGRPAEALMHFERAVAAGARTTAALNGLGFARLETGDRAGALEALRASLALEARQPGVAQAVRDLSGGTR
jgi:arylsulfatase A-like enzyme/Tfp pilus assembly protein PilF